MKKPPHEYEIFVMIRQTSIQRILMLGPSAMAVWLVFSQHIDWNTGISFPSVREIMRKAGISSATVQTAIKRLSDNGLLELTGKSPLKTNSYLVFEPFEVFIDGRIAAELRIPCTPASFKVRTTEVTDILSAISSGRPLPKTKTRVDFKAGRPSEGLERGEQLMENYGMDGAVAPARAGRKVFEDNFPKYRGKSA